MAQQNIQKHNEEISSLKLYAYIMLCLPQHKWQQLPLKADAFNDADDLMNGAWYLPAREELKMLCAGYSGKVYELIVGWFFNNMPDYDLPECEAARTQFDTKLTAKSGDAISVAEWYLSSFEDWANGSIFFNVESAYTSYFSKSDDGNIRWVREY